MYEAETRKILRPIKLLLTNKYLFFLPIGSMYKLCIFLFYGDIKLNT